MSNFGILPLTFVNPDDWNGIALGDQLELSDLRETLATGSQMQVVNIARNESYTAEHSLSKRQVEMILAGGLIGLMRGRHGA